MPWKSPGATSPPGTVATPLPWPPRSAAGAPTGPLWGPSLPGEALAAFARSLWEAFPDLSFELVRTAETGAGTVTAEWLLHGTHTG